MHQSVGGGEPVGHLVRERLHPHPGVTGEVVLQLLAKLGVAAAEANDLIHAVHGAPPACPTPFTASTSRTAPSTSPTPQPPPETRTILAPGSRLRARRASTSLRGSRNSGSVNPWTQWTLAFSPAISCTSSIDSGWVTRCRSAPGVAQ